MSQTYIRYPLVGGGVPIYANLAAFPVTAVTGSLGVAADTGVLYEFNGASWVAIGGPGIALSIGSPPNGLSITSNVLSLALSSTSTTGALSNTDWNTFNSKQPAGSYITALTGDASATGPGSAALTFATVNTNTGSFGSSTAIPSFTVNGKGLITAASTSAVIAPAGTLTGTTLNSTVVTSSLTSLGTQNQALNMGSHQINAVSTPTLSTDAANKGYVDAAISGLTWQGPAQAYAASNVLLAGATPLVIDSYTALDGDLVILGAQTIASQNGEYVVAITGGSYTLTANGLPTAVGDAWLITKGTVYADSAFTATAAVPAATFIEFAGPTALIYNLPLSITGNTVSIANATGAVSGIVSTTTQSFGGNKTFTGTIGASNLSGTNTGDVTIGTANGLSLSSQALSLGTSSTSTTGALTSTDWNTFNNKQATLTLGNLTDAGTDGITVTGGTGAVVGSGTSIAQHVADTTHNGYLSSTDWNTFNNKQSTLTLSNLTDTGTDGITITGGTGAVVGSGTSISQHVADTTHNGYLSSTDWNTFNGKQASGSYITALTGDVTASGPGSSATTLATVNGSPGSFGGSSHLVSVTVNAKGLVTAASQIALKAPTMQMFTSGSGTYTTPAGALWLKVQMVGGGGGGASNGAGGGASGSTGGNTTFGTSLLNANGGGGGTFNAAGGAGGSNSIGAATAVFLLGGTGESGQNSAQYLPGGSGASSYFGGFAGGQFANNGPNGAANTGAGGAGAGSGSVANTTGSGGGSGGFIEAYIPSPSATYAYAVGAGGAAGTTTGAGAFNGGTGGAGIIIVTEYYQ